MEERHDTSSCESPAEASVEVLAGTASLEACGLSGTHELVIVEYSPRHSPRRERNCYGDGPEGDDCPAHYIVLGSHDPPWQHMNRGPDRDEGALGS